MKQLSLSREVLTCPTKRHLARAACSRPGRLRRAPCCSRCRSPQRSWTLRPMTRLLKTRRCCRSFLRPGAAGCLPPRSCLSPCSRGGGARAGQPSSRRGRPSRRRSPSRASPTSCGPSSPPLPTPASEGSLSQSGEGSRLFIDSRLAGLCSAQAGHRRRGARPPFRRELRPRLVAVRGGERRGGGRLLLRQSAQRGEIIRDYREGPRGPERTREDPRVPERSREDPRGAERTREYYCCSGSLPSEAGLPAGARAGRDYPRLPEITRD